MCGILGKLLQITFCGLYYEPAGHWMYMGQDAGEQKMTDEGIDFTSPFFGKKPSSMLELTR